jgi:DNA-directed RNA polymerase specialized sigma24 family protein
VLLLPLLRTAREPESEEGLARLIDEHAAPIIRGVIGGKLHARAGDHSARAEAEDLYGDVVVQLLARLRAFVADPEDHSIGDFRGYVAVTTYNACNLYLRRRYPARWRLKNRLRYALSRPGDFALWEGDNGDWLCGLRRWRGLQNDATDGARRLRRFADDPSAARSAAGAPQSDLTDLLRAVFGHVGGPVKLEELVGVVAELQGVRDTVVAAVYSPDEPELGGRSGGSEVSTDFAVEVERRSYLRRLWDEIVGLPPMQRAALLLNLRAGDEGVIALLPLAGVAGVRRIAEAVGVPAEQFAALWNDLPLDDAAIARLLGVTRQQVINLRKAARARLARRMSPLGNPH